MLKWCFAAMVLAACGGQAVGEDSPNEAKDKGAGGTAPCNCSEFCSVALCGGETVCCAGADRECGCRARDECNKSCQ